MTYLYLNIVKSSNIHIRYLYSVRSKKKISILIDKLLSPNKCSHHTILARNYLANILREEREQHQKDTFQHPRLYCLVLYFDSSLTDILIKTLHRSVLVSDWCSKLKLNADTYHSNLKLEIEFPFIICTY